MVVAIKRATEPYESKQAKELELAGKPSKIFPGVEHYIKLQVFQ